MNMGKIRVFLIHLLCSATVVGAFVSLVSLIWYPAPYLTLSGVIDVVAVLVLVDVVLGPLLTLIIFKPGKQGLKMDLAIIFSVQIAAFLYGANLIYSQRPAYVVYIVDRFEVVSAAEVELSSKPPFEIRAGVFSGPVLVYSNGPDDPVERGQILLEAAAGGADVRDYPEYYKPYQGSLRAVLERARPAQVLIDSGRVDKQVISSIAGDLDPGSVGFIPVVGRSKVMSMLINPLTGIPMGAVDVEIW